jgi:hypothetical protein
MRLALSVLLVIPCAALAARPFVTDDARVVDEGGCQVETFYKRQQRFNESEFWFLPACNPLGVELTLGGIWLRSAPLGNTSSTLAQGKMLLKPLATNGAGFALSLGLQDGVKTSPYFNGIGSFSFADDRFIVHANLGGIRDRIADMGRLTWGVGAEVQLSPPRWIGIIESYGQRGDKPTLHTGLRIWIVPNRVQVDATIGFQQSSPERRFHTIGLRVLWD